MLDRLDRNATTELVRYTATDVTPSFRQALLGGLASPKLAFQARSHQAARMPALLLQQPVDTRDGIS